MTSNINDVVSSPSKQVYNNFESAYEHFNVELFDGKLPSCVITVQRKANTFGYFSANRWGAFIRNDNMSDKIVIANQKTCHEIALNPAYFAGRPLIEVFQTMVHEQVHLWQNDFGKPSIKTYHNKEWADKMESIGLMPSNTGKPGGKRTGQQMMDYPIKGGRFMFACISLIENGFILPWIDRAFVPNRLDLSPSPEFEADNEECDNDDRESNYHNSNYEEALYAPIENSAPLLLTSNSVSKALHVCPKCSQRCWGKPSLNILCGICNVKFKLSLSTSELSE